MTRPEAYQILTTYLTDVRLLYHSRAVEAAMKALYARVTPIELYNKEDEVKWGIAGLLHDADYMLARGKPEQHGLLLFTKEPNKIPHDIEHAIKAHNYPYTKVQPQTLMDFTLLACDQLTAIIMATTLEQPDKRIYLVTPDLIREKLEDKTFAKGVNRKDILLCETILNLKVEEFITIVLKAMQILGKEIVM